MHKTVVDANSSPFRLNLRELWAYRDLFIILAYRDLRVRYAQTFLGLFWAFIQPAATLLIFSVVFGRAVKVDTGGIPYPVFAIAGMSAWTYFAFVLNQSGNSIIGAQEMVKKIYFPRLVIPLSKAVVGLVDFAIVMLFLVGLMLIYRVPISANIWALPFFLLLTVVSSLAVGIWLSALTIRYRDFQHVVPFMVQFGLYATPIAYPAETIVKNLPHWANVLYYLNPMAGVVEGFRWAIIGGAAPSEYSWISFGLIFLLFLSGIVYFKKIEKVMADIV
ncbi:ABC transporter permease [Cytophagales bacterium LB-30]|uniref:Transport permease protein n=1 Tax=Shiella aurantiaca TaxID=3058365 RepID=A0ABT8F2R9_9BACT|nr:ABC transporter permease [Shiella aurantiaca]MDN4164752.1 ABC transporter permease [Shiella aurantiaca]